MVTEHQLSVVTGLRYTQGVAEGWRGGCLSHGPLAFNKLDVDGFFCCERHGKPTHPKNFTGAT